MSRTITIAPARDHRNYIQYYFGIYDELGFVVLENHIPVYYNRSERRCLRHAISLINHTERS